MSVWKDPETGNRIEESRYRDQTLVLKPDDTVGQLYLSALREFVRHTEHLPGDATVHPRTNGIEINHRVYEEQRGR